MASELAPSVRTSRPIQALFCEAHAPLKRAPAASSIAAIKALPIRPVIPKTAMLSSSATSCSFSTLDGLEEALDAIEPGAFPRAVIALALAHGRIELTQEILLLFRQVDGRLHDDSTEQIALLAASHRLHAFFAHTVYAARLRLRGNLELDRAAERRDDEADRYLARQMGAIALEDRMFANANLDIQIARRSAISPRLALSGQADPVAGIDAFRHFDVERLLLAYPSLTETGIA